MLIGVKIYIERKKKFRKEFERIEAFFFFLRSSILQTIDKYRQHYFDPSNKTDQFFIILEDALVDDLYSQSRFQLVEETNYPIHF